MADALVRDAAGQQDVLARVSELILDPSRAAMNARRYDRHSAATRLRRASCASAIAATAAAAFSARALSATQGELCALGFGLAALAVLFARKPDSGLGPLSDVIRSPWLVLGFGMTLGAVVLPVDSRFGGAQLLGS